MSNKLPKSWGLKEKRRTDGKLDILGKDDFGKEYRVRTTDTPEITDKDLSELKAADRESYPNRQAGAKQLMKNLVGEPEKFLSPVEQVNAALTFDESDWIAAAEPVVHAGLGRQGCTLGSTRSYRRGWERIFERSN